jgi:flavin reductase (DIM6/NTAB) family NADH-FMN oxidoreductase RutF
MENTDWSRKVASNVVIVGTKNNIMTCAWITRISFNPGLLAISIGKDRASHEMIKKSKEFGISFTTPELSTLANVAGSNSFRDVDKISALKELGFKFYKAKKIDAIMVEGCANAECKVVNSIDAGDHTIFVGEVIESSGNEKEPMLYSSGKYWKLGENVAKPSKEEMNRIKSAVEKNKK